MKTATEPPAADDELADFFGGAADSAPADGDDLFASDGSDDLFGGDDDDDLFGGADDLFAAPEPPMPPEPTGSPPEPEPAAESPDNDEDALKSLFDDSDAGNKSQVPAKSEVREEPKVDAPDFDWEDDDQGQDGIPLEYGDAAFVPAIQDDQADEVLQQTLVRDPVAGNSQRSGFNLLRIVGLLLILLAVGVGTVLFLNPEIANYLLVQAGIKQPAVSKVFEIQVKPVGETKLRLLQNRNGFSVLVAEGMLENQDTVPHSFVMLQVSLLDDARSPVSSETVYAGNILSPLQLRNFPSDELRRILAVEVGDSLRNFNIRPNDRVPFNAVFIPAPTNYLDLEPRVTVLNSARGER